MESLVHQPANRVNQLMTTIAASAVAIGWSIAFSSDGAAQEQALKTTSPPNILLILADDLGFSDVGCYGSEIKTPNLDALARRGLRYKQFYNTARCWPTRSALLTGYYAQQIRRDRIPGQRSGGHGGKRPDWAPLLSTLIKKRGYRCYHSGKWHIDGQVLANGFDRSYRLNDHDRFFSPRVHLEDDKPLPPVERGSGHYSTTYIADHAIRCLKEHSDQHQDKPFFSYLAFTSPHFPLHGLKQDIDRYRETYRVGWKTIREQRYQRQRELGLIKTAMSKVEPEIGPPYHRPQDLKKLGAAEVNRPLPWNKLSKQQQDFQAAKMAIHAAMVDRMDREIGRVIAQIRRMKQLENTLIVFLSDNGASAEIMVRGDGHQRDAEMGSADSYLCLGPGWSTVANSPFRRHKTWVHEGGIATPMIVSWPAKIKSTNEWRSSIGHVIDVVPTMLELSGTTNKPPVDAPIFPGRSFANTFSATAEAGKERILWWAHDQHRAIRVGNWKLVSPRGESWELFDLKNDRAETTNVIDQHRERARKMEQQWQTMAEEFAKHAGLQ